MNIRKWIVPSIALAAIAATHCGGDSSSTTPTTSSGTAGSGTAGSRGTGGSGMGGASTSSGTTGSGGSTSEDAGSSDADDAMGAGGSGSVDSGAGGSKADGAGGSAGSSAGGSAGSAPDAGRADGRNDAVAVTDTGASDASACPAGAPMDGEMCTGAEICTYGDVGCACVRAMGMRREWQCRRVPDAARDPDCPSSPPAAGTSCADAGAGTVCRYANNVFCACDQLDEWRCTL